MKLFSLKVATFLTLVSFVPIAMAQSVMLSEETALKNFEEAAKLYRKAGVDTKEPTIKEEQQKPETETAVEKTSETSDVTVISQEELDRYKREIGAEYAPIEDILVSVNLENKTLEQIVDIIIQQSNAQVGEWSVNWRLSPEHNYIMSERVNLTADTDLSNFMSYLVDRVNNMTGVQLFVTVFDKSRIIIISDTYY